MSQANTTAEGLTFSKIERGAVMISIVYGPSRKDVRVQRGRESAEMGPERTGEGGLVDVRFT